MTVLNKRWVQCVIPSYSTNYEIWYKDDNMAYFDIDYSKTQKPKDNYVYMTFENNDIVKKFTMNYTAPTNTQKNFVDMWIAGSYKSVDDITPSNLPVFGKQISRQDEIWAGTNKTYAFSDEDTQNILKYGLIIKCDHGSFDGSRTYVYVTNLTFQVTEVNPNATIDNLSTIGEYWEETIAVNWRSEYQTGYEYELYYNNNMVKSGSGGAEKSFTIPVNTFPGTLPSSVKVRTYNIAGSTKLYSGWLETRFTLKNITATISNLLVTGDYWERTINLSWQSNDQQQFKVEVLKNNAVVKTYTGTTAKTYTIPASQLTTGDHTFRVWVAYANRFVNNNERTITLKDILPTLKNVTLSGSNVDLPLSVNWESTDQQNYVLEVWKNDVKVKEYTGTTAKSNAIPNNTLNTGLTVFRVKVAYKDRWTGYEQMSTTLVETLPSIGVLEPDGVITERDSQTRIWWTSQNQSKWRLVIDDATTFTGATEKEKIIPAGTFTTGAHSMVLTVWYVTSLGVEKTPITKKSEWIVQGKPPIPTILETGAYTTSRPTIQWDTQDQQGYILDVLKDGNIIYTTDWVNGLVSEHKINSYLPNDTYTIRVKVMNQYSLESDYSLKDITVNATKPLAATLKYNYDGHSTTLRWDNQGQYTHFYILRNNNPIAKIPGTTFTEYTDYTCFGECTYAVRGITSADVYKDSNEVIINCVVTDGIMCTVDALDDVITVGLSQKQYAFSGDIEFDATEIFLSGRELPVAIFGEHRTGSYNIEFTSKELFRFLAMCKRRTVFMYRDKRQKLFLTIKAPSYEFDALGTTYSVSATEVAYNEVIDYD